MPKPKQFTNLKKSSKVKAADPETENDFLEAADAEEKGGGKWRAGTEDDPSHIFQTTQDPRIVAQIGKPIDLLRETLQAHQYALRLKQDNADILFNTAQVLTSLAELLSRAAATKPEAISLLQEAIELFSSCLTRQEFEFTEDQARLGDPGATQDDGASTDMTKESLEPPLSQSDAMDTSSTSSDPPAQWATVLEPVTVNTILETVLAQLSALTTLVTLSAPARDNPVATISELASPLIKQKIPYYVSLIPPASAEPVESGPSLSISVSSSSSDRPTTLHNPRASAEAESALAIACFKAAVSEAEYRNHLIDLQTYLARINDVFEPLTGPQTTQSGDGAPVLPSVEALCAYADALTDLSGAIGDNGTEDTQLENTLTTTRWQALSKAQELLGRASSHPSSNNSDAPSKTQIYLGRGDVELLRYRLAVLPTASAGVATSAPVVLKNAGVFYRGALAYAELGGDMERDNRNEAVVKSEVVLMLFDDSHDLKTDVPVQRTKEVLADMVEEGLLEMGIGGEKMRQLLLALDQ